MVSNKGGEVRASLIRKPQTHDAIVRDPDRDEWPAERGLRISCQGRVLDENGRGRWRSVRA